MCGPSMFLYRTSCAHTAARGSPTRCPAGIGAGCVCVPWSADWGTGPWHSVSLFRCDNSTPKIPRMPRLWTRRHGRGMTIGRQRRRHARSTDRPGFRCRSRVEVVLVRQETSPVGCTFLARAGHRGSRPAKAPDAVTRARDRSGPDQHRPLVKARKCARVIGNAKKRQSDPNRNRSVRGPGASEAAAGATGERLCSIRK